MRYADTLHKRGARKNRRFKTLEIEEKRAVAFFAIIILALLVFCIAIICAEQIEQSSSKGYIAGGRPEFKAPTTSATAPQLLLASGMSIAAPLASFQSDEPAATLTEIPASPETYPNPNTFIDPAMIEVEKCLWDRMLAIETMQSRISVLQQYNTERAKIGWPLWGCEESNILKDGEVILAQKVVNVKNAPMEFVVTQSLLNNLEPIDVVATAYDLGPYSCGKSPEDPGYGITASGAYATPGHTVAVDPRRIPLGSVLYIDYPDQYNFMDGIYVARDTGGGVGGNRVDVYIGEGGRGTAVYNFCMQFGVRDVTMYILK